MTDRELLYIKTIAEEKNISAAAKKLFITQPALSHCLRSLEQETGTPLFIRTPSGLKPTFAGECYYDMAMNILDIYNEYQQKLMDFNQMRRGRVRIGMTRYISAMLLPRILPEFTRRYPNIEIQLRERNSQELEMDIAARKIDFAVIHGLDLTEEKVSGGISYHPLSKDDFLILLQKGDPAGERAARMTGYTYPVLDPKYLEDRLFVLETPSHRMRSAIDNIFKRANIAPKVLLETELFETAQRLTEAGCGLTLMNQRYTELFMDTGKCDIYSIPKKYKPFWTLCLILPAGGYIPVSAQILIDMIREQERQ